MLICRMIIELMTPLQVGGGHDPLQDNAADRDALGLWRIPGSSLAGVLRAETERLCSAQTAEGLFGSNSADCERGASKIWCYDGRVLDYGYEQSKTTAYEKLFAGKEIRLPSGPFVRDHVRLNPERGAAEDGGKFDEEIVPPGTRFALEFKLDGWERELQDGDEEIFLTLCRRLGAGEIAIGGGQTNGSGKIRALYNEVRRFDLKNEQELLQWLNLSDGICFAEGEGQRVALPEDSLEQKAGEGDLSFRFRVPLLSCGPLLPGGINTVDLEQDMVCLRTPCLNYEKGSTDEFYTLPGSSLKGALRHRIYDIASLRYSSEERDALVDSLFGYVQGNRKTESEGVRTGQAGKLICTDIYLRQVKAATAVQHVAIDRFTGGALQGALFDEAPVWQEGLTLEVCLEGRGLGITEGEILCHALLDLFSGRLPVGGGVNRGNGILKLQESTGSFAKSLQNIPCEGRVKDRKVSNLGELFSSIAEEAA